MDEHDRLSSNQQVKKHCTGNFQCIIMYENVCYNVESYVVHASLHVHVCIYNNLCTCTLS